MEFREDDQAGMIQFVFGEHLKKHDRVADPNCDFCRKFILPEPDNINKGFPLESYRFVIIDVSSSGNDVIYNYIDTSSD